MTQTIRVGAPAKINLTLEVVARLPNGYHAIRSIFVKLQALADDIAVRIDPDGDLVTIGCDSAGVPRDETNLCHRAVTRYLAAIGRRAAVHVEIAKRIPVAAGLGGGSSDAAAVLKALNGHFDRALSPSRLAELGDAIGKDVPFFLSDAEVAFVSGTGEVIEPLAPLPALRFLIVNPGVAVSTREAYESLSTRLWYMSDTARTNASARMAQAIAAGDAAGIAAALYNDFEIVVEARHPVIKDLEQAMLAFGAAGACMSGSGPTVFGVFSHDDALRAAQHAISRHYPSFAVAIA